MLLKGFSKNNCSVVPGITKQNNTKLQTEQRTVTENWSCAWRLKTKTCVVTEASPQIAKFEHRQSMGQQTWYSLDWFDMNTEKYEYLKLDKPYMFST